jgi:tetratricopeptide (TPR) repeat protein
LARHSSRSSQRRTWPGLSIPSLLGIWLLLVVVTSLVYRPAWHGGMVWDDEGHITPAALRHGAGVRSIWFDLGATQQYYPLTHSVFWVGHRLWGDDTTGYHLLNIFLHASSAFLVFLLLRRLRIPGALLCAAIFALHPVHVESVAWISELKNTLSGFFCLAAALAYVIFDDTRDSRSYQLSVACFVLALLSKTVTATLAGALLVLMWWRRGRLAARRDLAPLIPFFLLGAISGLLTLWVERALVGARGAEFAMNPVERMLVAGRAIWFYLGKLVWPADLSFNYPRWTIDAGSAGQYAFPAAVVAAGLALWAIRRRSRAPLAAFLIFCGTLIPVLGFFNVYPFRYAFVADHFQYLASIPMFAVFSALVVGRCGRLPVRAAVIEAGAVIVLASVLGTLTWRESHAYADVETLYRTTVDRNPTSWLAQTNLGTLLLDRSTAEALEHLQISVQLRPDVAQTRVSLGYALQQLRRFDEAIVQYEEARRLDPRFPEAHNNLCAVLHRRGRAPEAIASCAEALRLAPDYAKAHFNMALALAQLGRSESIPHFHQAIELDPGNVDAHIALADALQARGEIAAAVPHYRSALQLAPSHAYAHNSLGVALQRLGRTQDAVGEFHAAVRVAPEFGNAHFNLANALQALGRTDEALPHYRAVLAQNPDDASAHTNLGVALQRLGRRDEAIEHYRIAVRLNPGLVEAVENLKRLQAVR